MKELEIEYTKQISLETPDLWSRIEAGIDEYEVKRKQNEVVSETEVKEEKTDTIKIQKRNRTIIYLRNTVMAAAALLLAVGVFKMVGGVKNTTMDAATDNSISYSAEAPAQADTAPAYEETAQEAECEEEAAFEVADDTADGYRSDSKETFTAAPAESAGNSFIVTEPDTLKQSISLAQIMDCDVTIATGMIETLNDAGIKEPYCFEANNTEETREFNNKSKAEGASEKAVKIFFKDMTDDTLYYMICTKGSDTGIEIKAVYRADTDELIYELKKE